MKVVCSLGLPELLELPASSSAFMQLLGGVRSSDKKLYQLHCEANAPYALATVKRGDAT